ncbi:MAG: outer membrane protein transport protein [Gammaproteobacteria bacterium]|nr:outer membrane protein transport protein [Gammaproteobacteria bacterium]
MSQGFKKSLIALSVSGLLMSPLAQATNGYFAHGYSTKEKGLAGAGVAHSQDALASATNPAGLVNVGERMDMGAALFNPNREYSVSGTPAGGPLILNGGVPGTNESSHDVFLIPHFGYTMKLDDTSVFGIAAYGNGGMNTDYENVAPPAGFPTPSGTFGAGAAGVDLKQLFINATYAKTLDDKHSVGASVIFAYQMFKAHGLASFGGWGGGGFDLSTDDANLSDRGDDTSMGFGAKLGWQGKVTPEVTLGASYQTKMAMSEFDKYKGLFAEQGDFDIPATMILGAAWDIDDKRKLVVDIQQIYYSDVASIGNPMMPNLGICQLGGNNQDPNCLGGSNGAGFGWDDMTVIKLGYEWLQNDMTLRVGYSQGDHPISDSEVMFNILAPAVIEQHLTFGMTMPMGSNNELSVAAMYAFEGDVSGPNMYDGMGTGQRVELAMDQFEIQASYTMKF